MTNLTNTRWRFRAPVDFSMLSIPTGGFSIKWYINFTNAIGQSKTYLSVMRGAYDSPTSTPSITESGSTVYSIRNGVPKWTKWADEIYITGGADVANADLIAFLEANADPYYFYRAERQDLISVADAIRAKGGTSAPLTFPDGFVDAIGDIQTEPNLQTKAATPSELAQTITADSGYDGLSQVDIGAVPSSYVGSGVVRRDSTDLSVSGNTVTVPSGYYENDASKEVQGGSGYDVILKDAIDGTMTELSNLPSTVAKIKPYAFYHSTDYQPVEYIESSGNAIVVTGIDNSGVTNIDIVTKGNSVTNASQIVLSSGVGGNGGSWFGSASQGKWMLGSAAGAISNISCTNKVRAHLTCDNSGESYSTDATLTYNGSSETITRTGTAPVVSINFQLFGAMSSGQPSYLANAKIYELKFTKNGVVVGNYVPVKRKDGVYGFYDVVSNAFYGATTGTLTGGNAVYNAEFAGVLKTVDLSENVTEIGEYAFSNNELDTMTLRANQVVTLGGHALDGTKLSVGTGNIYVPSALVSAYQSAWSAYASLISSIS